MNAKEWHEAIRNLRNQIINLDVDSSPCYRINALYGLIRTLTAMVRFNDMGMERNFKNGEGECMDNLNDLVAIRDLLNQILDGGKDNDQDAKNEELQDNKHNVKKFVVVNSLPGDPEDSIPNGGLVYFFNQLGKKDAELAEKQSKGNDSQSNYAKDTSNGFSDSDIASVRETILHLARGGDLEACKYILEFEDRDDEGDDGVLFDW